MKTLFLASLCTLMLLTAQGQKKVNAGFVGQIALTTDLKAAYINFGGPMLSLALNKNAKLGIGMYPSLRLKQDAPRPIATPTLGAGMQFMYKKLVVVLPCYYQASNTSWYLSAGVGIKL